MIINPNVVIVLSSVLGASSTDKGGEGCVIINTNVIIVLSSVLGASRTDSEVGKVA